MTIRTRIVHPDVPGSTYLEIPEKHRGSRIRMQGLTLSADGKTMYVMAVDNVAGAPYEGRVLAMPLP